MKICVVGAGPAAAYFIKEMLLKNSSLQFDVFEKETDLLGHLKRGVAPDQRGIRDTIQPLERVFKLPSVNTVTNKEVGKDIALKDIQNRYSAIVIAGGAEERRLNIPGAEHALSADKIAKEIANNRSALGNSIPKRGKIGIIGNGNVSIDMARMLLHSKEMAAYTQSLNGVAIDEVEIIGRKSLSSSKFTNPVLSELLSYPSTAKVSSRVKEWMESKKKEELTRAQRRKIEIIEESTTKAQKDKKVIEFTFWETPLSIRKTKKNEKTGYELTTVDDRGTVRRKEYDAIISAIGYTPKDWKDILDQVTVPVYFIGWAQSEGRGTLTDALSISMETAEKVSCGIKVQNRYNLNYPKKTLIKPE